MEPCVDLEVYKNVTLENNPSNNNFKCPLVGLRRLNLRVDQDGAKLRIKLR